MLAEITTAELQNAGIIAIAFLLLIAIAETWHRSRSPPVEWTRKLVHFFGGMVCLSLPFLIESHWVVLGLAISMGAIFVTSKKLGWLASIHGIQRSSSGTEFYPLVIYLLFLLSGNQVWQYIICVLTLAISDSAAAIIGTRYGNLKFLVEDEQKSVEGSLSFFVVTFAAVLVPLLIWEPLADRPDAVLHYVLASTLIGGLVTCFEIVSLQGTDNLWVPLGAWLVLTKTMQTDSADLQIQNTSFFVILAASLSVARFSHLLNVGGALICCVTVYGLWAMGSFDWAIVFFISFAVYFAVAYLCNIPWQIRVRAAAYSVTPPFLMLAIANVALNSQRPDIYDFFFGPFLTTSCTALSQAISNLASWQFRKYIGKRIRVAIGASIASTGLIVLVSFVRQSIWEFPSLMMITVSAVAATTSSAVFMPPLPPRDAPPQWLLARAVISIGAGVLVILWQWLSGTSVWNPV